MTFTASIQTADNGEHYLSTVYSSNNVFVGGFIGITQYSTIYIDNLTATVNTVNTGSQFGGLFSYMNYVNLYINNMSIGGTIVQTSAGGIVYESYNSNITFYNVTSTQQLTGSAIGLIAYSYSTINMTFVNTIFNGKIGGSSVSKHCLYYDEYSTNMNLTVQNSNCYGPLSTGAACSVY
jgi:hypothetical protein